MSEECALKKKRECASDCEMVCIKGRVCVSVSESNVKNVVFTGSLPGTEGDCHYTKIRLYFILVRMYSLLLCSRFWVWLDKK